MKKIKLIEFNNKQKKVLRGIYTYNNKICEQIVIMAGGFERKTTTEKKFKALADQLINSNISSFRFDYSGIGLSDGDFSKTTIQSMSDDFACAYEVLRKYKFKKTSAVAHSLSACVVAKLNSHLNFNKITLISPALNQKELLRYWFTTNTIKINQPEINITWKNYQDYLKEKDFIKDCRKNKTTKENYINHAYFLENSNKDYSPLIKNTNNTLLVHGANDYVVPLESILINFKNTLIINKGDHNLERPDLLKQWLKKTVQFLKK